jgi:hypothetical protein
MHPANCKLQASQLRNRQTTSYRTFIEELEAQMLQESPGSQ